MEEKELKVGDKLYSREYYSSSFGDSTKEWHTYTILSIKRNRIKFKGGYGWTISVSDVGDTYFTTKKALILDKLELHKESLAEKEEELLPIKKEIKYLEKKLKEITFSSPSLKAGVSEGAD